MKNHKLLLIFPVVAALVIFPAATMIHAQLAGISSPVYGITANFVSSSVVKYDPVAGKTTTIFTVGGNGRGIAYDGTNLWYTVLGYPTGYTFNGDGLIHKIAVTGGSDITTIPDPFGAGGRGVGALDFDGTNLWGVSYLPDISNNITLFEESTTGTVLASCDLPFRDGGAGDDTLAIVNGKALTDGGEIETSTPRTLYEYSLPTSVGAGSCTQTNTYSIPVGVSGIDTDSNGNLVATDLFNIYNFGQAPYSIVSSQTGAFPSVEDISTTLVPSPTPPPAAPTITSPSSGTISNNPTPTISGTGVAGDTITVSDGATSIGTATVGGSNSWLFTPSTPLSVGSHTITATQTNAGGTSLPSNSVTYTVDDGLPPVTTIGAVTDGNSAPVSSGGSTTSGTIHVPFSATDDTGIASSSCKLDAATPATCTSSISYPNLAHGRHTVQISSTDKAGNVESTATFTWIVLPTISITNINPNPVLWGYTTTVSGSTTNFIPTATNPPVDSVTITWGDTNTNTGIVIAGDGSWSATHVYAKGKVGPNTVTANYINGTDSSTLASNTNTATVNQHHTALSATTLIPPSVKWSFPFTADPVLTDTDAAGATPPLPPGIAVETLTFNGTGTSVGLANPGVLSNVTGNSGTAMAPMVASGKGTVGTQNVNAKFAGDSNYLSSSSNTPITILPHATIITLNPIASPFVGNQFSVNGELDDADAGGTVPPIASGISGEPITFATSGGVPIVPFSVPTATTNGVTFSDLSISGLQVTRCGTCSGTVNVLRLNTGATISLPSNPPYVTLFLADMGGSTVTIQVKYADDSSNTFTSAPIGTGVVSEWALTSPSNVGINLITITGTSGGQAGISEVQTLDSILNLILDITFTPTSPTSMLSFNQGEYSVVAPAISTETTGLSATAQFASDPNYLAAGPPSLPSSSTQTFDVHASTSGGVGAPESSTSESGTAISTSSCPSGDSRDVDNLCKTWKGTGSTNGIPYTYNTYNPGPTGATAYYKLRDSKVGDFDVYYQIDAMTGYNPNTASINDVNNTFNGQSHKGDTVHLYYQYGEEGLTPVPSLHVWHGNDPVSSQTDYDSIKAYHFGTASEHPTIGVTPQAQAFTGTGPTFTGISITGVSITTPHDPNTTPVDVTEGTLIVKVNVTSSGTMPVFTAPTVAVTPGDVNLKIGPLTSAVTQTPKAQDSSHVAFTLFTVKVPFDSLVAGTSHSFTIAITTSPGTYSGTLSVNTATLSPTYQTTLLNAKAQAYRFALFVNSIDGGASGISQIIGNKLAVALGAAVFSQQPPTENEQAGTFMHEVGHNLGLNHGGPTTKADATVNCKPNYESIMSYSRQLPTYLGSNWNLDYSHGYLNNTNSGYNENTLTEYQGTPVSSGATQPWVVWGTPGQGQTFLKQQSAANGATPNNIDWTGDGDAVETGPVAEAAPISGFGITGCSETTAGAQNNGKTYYDYNDWNNLNGNFQTGFGVTIQGVSAAAAVDTKGGTKVTFTTGGDIDAPSSHKGPDHTLISTWLQQSSVFFGLVSSPIIEGGDTLSLNFPLFVSGTTLLSILHDGGTTSQNFVGYNDPSNTAPYIFATACTTTIDCANPTKIISLGNFHLNTNLHFLEFYFGKWQTPTVSTPTKYYISVFVSPQDSTSSTLLSSVLLKSPLKDPNGHTVTFIVTVYPEENDEGHED